MARKLYTIKLTKREVEHTLDCIWFEYNALERNEPRISIGQKRLETIADKLMAIKFGKKK